MRRRISGGALASVSSLPPCHTSWAGTVLASLSQARALPMCDSLGSDNLRAEEGTIADADDLAAPR